MDTPITIERLKAVGFIDPVDNGMAYRKEMPGGLMEIAWFCKVENHLRYQTIWSGVTIPLKEVNSMEKLNVFYFLITGEHLLLTP